MAIGVAAAVYREDPHLALVVLVDLRRSFWRASGDRKQLGVVVAEEELGLENGEDLIAQLVHVDARVDPSCH